MERRKFVVGLGALASGGAAAIGTGAFTSVEAERQVDVEVASDANAYLGLGNSGDPNDAYFDAGGGEYAVNFADISDDDDAGGGLGVNPNADMVAESVFSIENQGTQDVTVSLSSGNGDIISVSNDVSTSISAPSDNGIAVSLDDDADDTTLGVGESIDVDFAINSGTGNLDGDLTIEADAA